MLAAGEGQEEPEDTSEGFYRADDDDHFFKKKPDVSNDDDSDTDDVLFRCEACAKTFKVLPWVVLLWISNLQYFVE